MPRTNTNYSQTWHLWRYRTWFSHLNHICPLILNVHVHVYGLFLSFKVYLNLNRFLDANQLLNAIGRVSNQTVHERQYILNA